MKLTASDRIALASILIALCAMFLTLWEGREVRRHNRLSVTPILRPYVDLLDSGAGIFLENIGFGPATIREFVYVIGDKEYKHGEIQPLLNRIVEMEPLL